MNDTYYVIELEDHSVPPICSGCTRTYAGTKEMLAVFMEKLSASRGKDTSYAPLIEAHAAWLRGEPTGPIDYGYYCKGWNIRPLQVRHIETMAWPDFSMEHLNTWRWPYQFRADRVEARIVYARDGADWYRFVGAAFWNLRIVEEDISDFPDLPVRGYWGHPAILAVEDGGISSQLLFQERKLEDEAAVLRDIANPVEIDFAGFMQEVLGDG